MQRHHRRADDAGSSLRERPDLLIVPSMTPSIRPFHDSALALCAALALVPALACSPAAPGKVSAASQAAAPSGEAGIDLAGIDRSVVPGDDFFGHANGAWIK